MNKDRVGSLIFVLAGIYGILFSLRIPMGKWNEPGPGVFPLCVSILLLASGMAGFIRRKVKGEERKKLDWPDEMRKLPPLLKIVGLTAVFILALDRVGFLVATTLYLFLLLLWVSRYKLWPATGLAVGLGFGCWYFFVEILAVDLPKIGIWFL